MAKKYVVVGTAEKKGPYLNRKDSKEQAVQEAVANLEKKVQRTKMTPEQHSLDELFSSIDMIIDFIGDYTPLDLNNAFQKKVYDMFNKKYPITLRRKAVNGMIRIPAECMIMRAEDLIEAQEERDSKFAKWISTENQEKLNSLYDSVPRIKGVDSVERVDFKSKEYEAYTEFKSQLMIEAGLEEDNEKVLGLSLLSDNAIKKLMAKSNISVPLDDIPSGWSTDEILYAAMTMLKPEDRFNLLGYYSGQVTKLFEDGKVTEGTRNYWRSNFCSMNKFVGNIRSDLGDYNIEELSQEEKLNYAMVMPFVRLYNWIGLYTPSVDNLVNGESGENFHPSAPFDFKSTIKDLKSYYGTPIKSKRYFEGKEICSDMSGEFDSYKLINTIYNTYVDQLGFEVKEMKSICGFTTKEIDEYLEIRKRSDEKKEKSKEVYEEIKLSGKLLNFYGEYRCLNTYSKIPTPIEDEMGVKYNTIEEYFQCSKFIDKEDREDVSKLGPKVAGNEARSISAFDLKRRQWDGQKVMVEAIKKRCAVDPYFKTVLLDTAKKGLFIKCCFGDESHSDLNDYGYCLMKARKSL